MVLFSGGRGSGALAELVATDARVELTVAINGYDDGASTGEVRRFLGDALGPSDFRKNASRFARLRGTCPPGVIDLLDRRLPDDATADDLLRLCDAIEASDRSVIGDLGDVDPTYRQAVAVRLRRFDEERRRRDARSVFETQALVTLCSPAASLPSAVGSTPLSMTTAPSSAFRSDSSRTSRMARTGFWSRSTKMDSYSAARSRSLTPSGTIASEKSSCRRAPG